MEEKLKAEVRGDTGKGIARKLRAGGRVPAVLYGHGQDSVSLSVDAKELYRILHTGAGSNVLVDLIVIVSHDAAPRPARGEDVREQHGQDNTGRDSRGGPRGQLLRQADPAGPGGGRAGGQVARIGG